MSTVFQEWQSYRTQIVPPAADEVQVEECRRAFYAGAWAAYMLMMEATGHQDVDQCERELVALHDEIEGILKDLLVSRLVTWGGI